MTNICMLMHFHFIFIFLINVIIALTCRIWWNCIHLANTRKKSLCVYTRVRFLAWISKNMTREYLQLLILARSRMFHLKVEEIVFSCMCLRRASSRKSYFTAFIRNSYKYLKSFACICVVSHYFQKFLQVHPSFSELPASTHIFRTLTFDWAWCCT
jgi:hypothetical protein